MDSKCASCLSKISFFPENDDGVPPFCRNKNCPLDHRHWLNHWWVTEKLGRVGLAYFDQHRKVYFGFASLATILAMVITTYGCFALSTDPLIVQRTYWAGGI